MSQDNEDSTPKENLKGKFQQKGYVQDNKYRFQQPPMRQGKHSEYPNDTDLNKYTTMFKYANMPHPHSWINEKDFTSRDDNLFKKHLQEIRNAKGMFSKLTREDNLNTEQKKIVNVIGDWVKDALEADEKKTSYPKALRMFVIGLPGAGKTYAFKHAVSRLMDIEKDWANHVVFATATGAASYHMGYGAATVHRQFKFRINDLGAPLKDDQIEYMKQSLGPNLKLVVFDEISTLQRQLISSVQHRLVQCGYDVNKIGFVFMGDPAQTLPIGDLPVWSSSLYNVDKHHNHTDCTKESVEGLHQFRGLFRMKPLSSGNAHVRFFNALQKKKFDKKNISTLQDHWKDYSNDIFEGDYDTIYLSESNRKRDNPESREFTSQFVPQARYGNFSSKSMNFLAQKTAKIEEVQNPKNNWKKAITMAGKHYYNPNKPNVPNVDSINMESLVQYAVDFEQPLLEIKSQHWPVSKEDTLITLTAKEFEKIPGTLALSPGADLMITENINPSVGIFNGARCKFVGVIYLEKCISFQVEEKSLPNVTLINSITQKPFTLVVDSEELYISKGSNITLNNLPVEYENLQDVPINTMIKIQLPQHYPALPDYLVVEIDNFSEMTDLRVFEDDALKNCTLIAPRKVSRHDKNKKKSTSEKSSFEWRKGYPVELAYCYTTYKAIGDTHEKTIWKMKDITHLPGMAYVGFTRVREPKDLYIPETERPSLADLRLQRLLPVVIESENFERIVRVKSAFKELSIKFNDTEKQIATAIYKKWQKYKENEDEIIASFDTNLKNIYSIKMFRNVLDQLKNSDVKLLLNPIQFVDLVNRKFVLDDLKKSGKIVQFDIPKNTDIPDTIFPPTLKRPQKNTPKFAHKFFFSIRRLHSTSLCACL